MKAEPNMEITAWLQQWYLQQCDGDWEHGYGLHIGTLDNPGWTVDVNLAGTRYSELQGPEIKENYELGYSRDEAVPSCLAPSSRSFGHG